MTGASYALLPNLKKIYFWHRRGIENLCRLFSTHQRPNVFVSNAWPAPATYHRLRSERCDQRVGANERGPFRFHDAVAGFVHVCRGLRIAFFFKGWIFLMKTCALRSMTMERRCCQKKMDFKDIHPPYDFWTARYEHNHPLVTVFTKRPMIRGGRRPGV